MARKGTDCQGVPLNGELVKLGSVGDVVCQFADAREIRFTYSTNNSSGNLALDASARGLSALPIKPASNLQNNDEVMPDEPLNQCQLLPLVLQVITVKHLWLCK